MTAMYPSHRIYDIWAELGNPGWDAAGMAPYIKKFQTFHRPEPVVAKDFLLNEYMDYSLYGTDGPMQTSIPSWSLPMTKFWAEAWKSLKLLSNQDPITGKSTGSYTPPSYIDPKTARRSHTGTAYWEPVSKRPNLALTTGAMVEKVILEKSSTGAIIATGVQYRLDGQNESQIANAGKEVILSAGSFNSPALLELSGVGDDTLLASLGIKTVISNSNVGENFQDHPAAWVQFDAPDEQSLDSMKDHKRVEEAMQDYYERKTGPLSTIFNASGVFPIIGLIKDDDKETLQKLVTEYRSSSSESLSKAQEIQRNHILSIILDSKDSTGSLAGVGVGLAALLGGSTNSTASQVSIIAALLHPLSRGSSHIQSNDPKQPPKIDPQYLSHPLDLEIFARHILHMRTLVQTQPLVSITIPGGKMFPPKLDNLEDAKGWVKESSITQFHPCGTCAMLPKDMGGVVSNRLVVHGTKNLRVIDASIFPMIQKGSFASSVYAVAEKAADMIKQDLGMSP
jgi:choline dehydrogenase-like flavoprotein